MNHIKDMQRKILLFVFALGACMTYLVSLFLPLPYSGSMENKSMHTQKETSPSLHLGHGSGDMTTAMNMMNSSLNGKTGREFDKAFLAEMIMHHEGAIEMARTALVMSSDERIRMLANTILREQEREVSVMKEWQTELK